MNDPKEIITIKVRRTKEFIADNEILSVCYRSDLNAIKLALEMASRATGDTIKFYLRINDVEEKSLYK